MYDLIIPYRLFYALFIVVILSISLSTSLKADECQNYQQKAYDAYQQGDQARLETLNNQVQTSACSADDKAYVARQLALFMYHQLGKKTVKAEEKEQILKTIIEVYPFWQAFISLAEYYADKKQFDMARYYYQHGIEVLENRRLTPPSYLPPVKQIRDFKIAAQNAALASLALPEEETSSSRGVNVIDFITRSSKIERKIVPIQFNSNSSQPEGRDRKYAMDLYEKLKRLGQPNIVLIGHTDPKGAADYNRKLSKKRAKAVKQFLKQKGYRGNISTDGKGEDEPLLDPRANPEQYYGEMRWYRMLRRVEIDVQ